MKTPVLLYQMGRVGSLSVKTAMEDAGFFVDHCHSLFQGSEHYPHGINIEERPLIVSLVRDPIARNVSEFLRRLTTNQQRGRAADLVKNFLRDFNHIWPMLWWQAELGRALGVDIRSFPFNKRRGYSEYTIKGHKVIIIQTEKLSKLGHTALSDFLGKPVANIPHDNKGGLGNRKVLSESFNAALKESLSPALLDWYYRHPITRHFFSLVEIENFRSRWVL